MVMALRDRGHVLVVGELGNVDDANPAAVAQQEQMFPGLHPMPAGGDLAD
jgi:hypothetical protein